MLTKNRRKLLAFTLTQFGKVVNQVENRKDTGWGKELSEILLEKKDNGLIDGGLFLSSSDTFRLFERSSNNPLAK